MFINISLKKLKNNKLVWLFTTILIILLSIVMLYAEKAIIFGKKISRDNSNTFLINSYYAEYDMTIVSNKNINTYYIKEWYNKGNNRFEMLDSQGGTIVIIINEEKIYINNLNEKNKLVLNKLNYGGNITSFSTLLDMYKCFNNTKTNCNCRFSEYEKDEKIQLYIELTKNCKCEKCSKIAENVSYIMVEIDKEKNKPLLFTVNDKDKNVISSIVYTKFEKNIEIEKEMFSIP